MSQRVSTVKSRGLDPLWLGAIALLLLSVSTFLMLIEVFFDFAWQERLGGSLSVVATVLFLSIVIPLRLWTTSSHKA